MTPPCWTWSAGSPELAWTGFFERHAEREEDCNTAAAFWMLFRRAKAFVGLAMRNATLEYMSAVALELANLAETSGHSSLVVLFRKASAEAKLLQELQDACSAVPCNGNAQPKRPNNSYRRTIGSVSSADSKVRAR